MPLKIGICSRNRSGQSIPRTIQNHCFQQQSRNAFNSKTAIFHSISTYFNKPQNRVRDQVLYQEILL